ncbi:MAG: T9SS type A sorting domain-containing protein [Saprospiraceae bacterium]|nr:T9SS type A sorting domain-containing protein [Saprospiraceae bacterium]
MKLLNPFKILLINSLLLGFISAISQTPIVNISDQTKYQIIDGFGAHQGDASVNQPWWNDLYFNDMACSIYRVDLTPSLVSPYSDLSYFSPWFMGSSVKSVFNFEDPANPNGPEGNRVRTYTNPTDYSRSFGGRNAPIAVMGPDLEKNIAYFRYQTDGAITTGKSMINQLGDFKLVGSIWSPLPWLKVSSGNRYNQNWWPGPIANTAWPFIWGGNFAGGRLDVSGTPLAIFNDQSQGGSGPTTSLTQFARSTAAYIAGYQRFHGMNFYAISIQNELNFEEYYSSMTYPLSSQYIAALKAVRNEFDKYPELKSIRIMGPEDLLGGDSYGLWEYGGPTHKNLQYLRSIGQDPDALKAIDFFCIHGYAGDGLTAAGANPNLWNWWVNGWNASPAPGIPANIKGFSSFNKKSWMTETSGESPEWLFPVNGFPGDGAFGIGIRIHQALTTGMESAWIYWTFTTADNNGNVTNYGLTNANATTNSPKYNAAKHYFKFIRPGAQRIACIISGSTDLLGSAYIHESEHSLTIVLINTRNSIQSAVLNLPYSGLQFNQYTSSLNSYWKSSNLIASGSQTNISLPAYSIVTLKASIPVTATNETASDIPFQIIPNPACTQTIVNFELNESEAVSISIFDILGTKIQTLNKGTLASGVHSEKLNVQHLARGTYLVELRTTSSHIVKKIQLN